MGPGETQGTGTLYVVENGEYRELGKITDVSETIVAPSNEDTTVFPMLFPNDAECCFTVDITSVWPEAVVEKLKLSCKTRKRFKKLLMSIGYSRNETELYPFFAVPAYGSYRKAWKAMALSMVNWVF